jgi:hypothetical protein
LNRIVAVVIALVPVACGGGATDPNGEGGTSTFTAKVDGVDWAPDFTPSAQNPTYGSYSITALKSVGPNNYSLALQLRHIRGAGTYPLGVGPLMSGGTGVLQQPGSGWATPLSGVAGEIVITTLTATRMVGSFEFVATPSTGSTVDKAVTEGLFDVPVTGAGGLGVYNQGLSFSASIGAGEAFVAATGTVSIGTGLLIQVSNGVRTIIIDVASFSGVNTYALGAAPARRLHLYGSASDPLSGWTTNTTGGSGSVTITSYDVGRIDGTFSATVVGVNNATGSLTVSGSFSMGLLFV